MRVGLVRKVGLGAIALVAIGMAGCDDNPLTFEHGVAVLITTNPTSMIIPGGDTTLLVSRTVDAGSRPTWDDIDPSIDATCGDGDVDVVVAESYEPAVQPPGVFDVIGGTTLGETCIELTGGGVSATVDVAVVADSLEIAATVDTLDVFGTTQLLATAFGGGVQMDGLALNPDVTWSSSNDAVVTVDADGVATGTGAGSATITATWSSAGVSVPSTNSIEIAVRVPVPVLTSTDVAAAGMAEMVTITGTGFLVGPHGIFIDGEAVPAAYMPTIVDGTTATFLMPQGPAATVQVSVGSTIAAPLGGLSNELGVDRTTDDEEPDNDNPYATTTAFPALPVNLVRRMGFGDVDDFYTFDPGAAVTIDFGLDWIGDSPDLDILFTDGAFSAYFPVYGCATGAVPEACQGTFPAGSYLVWVNDFAGAAGLTEYTLTAAVAP